MAESEPPEDPGTPADGPGSGEQGRARGRGRSPLELGREVGALRDEVRELTGRVTGTDDQTRSLSGELAELWPRVETLEQQLDELAARLPADDAGPADGQRGATPALRWAGMSRDEAAVAWELLARFVAEVLNDGYVLTRVELPDCWATHPRAVRELAWLRTSFHAANTPEAGPHGPAEWHARWLPDALRNLAATIDPRECAPGKHRVTEDERFDYDHAVADAHRAGQPLPALTAETGPGRPRYDPDRFPRLRSPAARRGAAHGPGGPPLLDEDTPPPASRPADWLPFFWEVRDADLRRRQRTPVGPDDPGPPPDPSVHLIDLDDPDRRGGRGSGPGAGGRGGAAEHPREDGAGEDDPDGPGDDRRE